MNQGDALEHNFSAIYGALTLPINHVFSAQTFPMVRMYIVCIRGLCLSGNCLYI